MPETVIRTASARKTDIETRARAMGVDEAYVEILVERFYDRVRADGVLGPVFDAAIKGEWGPHLETMKQFWASIALDAGTYAGRPIPAHHKHLDKIRPEHFERWLSLFAQTLNDTAPSPVAAAFFLERAERIGESFKTILFR